LGKIQLARVVDPAVVVFDYDSEFLPEIRQQANLAMAEAAVAVVVVDWSAGLTAADQSIAEWFCRPERCPRAAGSQQV